MIEYVSNAGLEELKSLRIDCDLSVTSNQAPIEMLARVPSDECGCPEEIWRIQNIIALIHLEENRTGEMFFFLDGEELEETVNCTGLDDLRAKMFARFASMGTE